MTRIAQVPQPVDPARSSADDIRRIQVWPGWLRLSHWLIAGGVLFEVLSAWALQIDTTQRAFWLDWHLIVGQAVLLALLLRLALMMRPGTAHWRTLLPDRSQLGPMLAMLKFYLSLGRLPLPQWHAHNPLWKPVYLLVFVLLLGCVSTGLGYRSVHTFLGLPMDVLHGLLADGIVIFTVLHIVAVGLHDLSGQGAFVSAMINGHRYFHVPPRGGPGEEQANDRPVYVSIDRIGSTPGRDPAAKPGSDAPVDQRLDEP